jgi:DNA-binding PadR family transcriptional regulator
MTALTVPHVGRRRRGPQANLWFMTDEHPTGERPRRRGRGRHGRGMHGPGGFGEPFFGPGRRAGRGDIRAAILALLAEEPMHGYQIIQVISERSGGNWRPSPGSVYPTLQQLEDEGLVEPAASESGRRVYTLTESGRTANSAETAPAPWEEAGDEIDHDLVELRDLAHQVLAATRQVAQAGTAAQVKGAQNVLRAARKGIYRLLAEDDTEA